MATTFEPHPIGRVRSPIQSREQAPKQGDEGAPEAWLEIAPAVAEAARHLRVGEEVILLTWLDRADRSVLSVRPRGDERRPLTGVLNLGAITDTLVQVAEAAKEAGDDARVAAALDALDRMRNGEDPQAVYAEWLTAQRPPLANGGSGAGR